MEVYFSCGPAESDSYYPMWLRNTLIVDYPENKYLVHLQGEGVSYESVGFEDFVDKRFTHHTVAFGDGEDDSTSPKITFIMDEEEDPVKALHVCHIMVGAFVVHLVGRKDAEHFDRMAHELMEADWGTVFLAGHLELLMDKDL